jgi:hypothetical protein
VLADEFTERENFPDASGVRLGYGYEDDSYVLTPPTPPGYVRVLQQSFLDPDYRNLSLNALAGPEENSGAVEYGVLFWHGEDERGRERFLAFTVNTRSAFRLLAYEPLENEDGETNAYQFTEVIPSTQTETIRPDGKPNALRVDVHPRRMLAYINDELVLDTDAEIINDWRVHRDWDGRVGLVAFALDTPTAQARFTNLTIYADVKQP